MAWCARANAPCGSNLKNTRAQALMKFSWNIRWWNDRCHPCRSMASSASLHCCILANPSRARAPDLLRRNRCSAFRLIRVSACSRSFSSKSWS